MSEDSRLIRIISSANTQIAACCKQFIDAIPYDDKSYKLYLRNFSFKDNPIYSVIKNSASHGYRKFLKSYDVFCSCFPPIKKTTNESPKRENGKPYFTEFLKIDWSDELIKSPLIFFMEKCKAQFTLEMILLKQKLKKSDVKEFLNNLIEYVSSLNPPTNDIESISHVSTMENWSVVIYEMSKLRPSIVWKILQKNILNQGNKDFISTCFLTAFSSIKLNDDFKDAPKQVICDLFLLMSERSNNHIFCEKCIKFMHNLVYQYSEFSKEPFDCDLTQSIFAEATTQLDFNEEAFNLIAHMSNSIANSNFDSMRKYISFFNQVKPEMRSSFIRSITFKLFGENYATPTEIEVNNVYYRWNRDDSEEDLDIILKFMLNNDSILQDYGVDLARVVQQMIIVNMPYFMNKILPQMDDSQSTRVNICCSLYLGLKLFFVNYDAFIKLNTHKDYLDEFEKQAKHLIVGFLRSIQADRQISILGYSTPSYTSILTNSLTSAKDKGPVLREQIKKLNEYAKPNFTEGTQVKDVSKYIEQLSMVADPKIIKIYNSYTLADKNEIDIPPLNPDLQNILSLAVYLKHDDDSIDLLCKAILSKSPYNGAMAVCVLQALIHLHRDYVDSIIQHLCEYFLTNEVTLVSLTLVINAICLTLESANYEGAAFSEMAMSKISFVAIIGFCVPSPMIHQKIFSICKMLSNLKDAPVFHLPQFLEQYEDEISSDAMRKATQAIIAINDTDVKLFTPAPFHDVALARSAVLYMFYVSSFGYFLRKRSQYFESTIHYAAKVLCDILFSMPEDKMSSKFAQNCLALLLSISEEMNDFRFSQIQRICSKVIYNTASTKNPKSPILLIAMFSGMTFNLFVKLMPLFSRTFFPISRAFSFITEEMIKRKTFICINQNQKILPPLYSSLHVSLILSYKIFLSEKLLFAPGSRKLEVFSQIHLFINNFSKTLDSIFEKISLSNYIKSIPLFTCLKIQTKKEISHPFNSEKWFIFFCNLITTGKTIFLENLVSAFNKWLVISHIPDQHFNALMEKLPQIGKICPDISATIFQQNPGNLLPFYIKSARSNFHMFNAIASLVLIPNVPSEKFVPETLTFKYGDIEYFYYKHCGSLLALSLYYLISTQVTRRTIAQKFLASLILIIGVFRNDPISAAGVYKFLNRKLDVLKNSFSVFLQRDLETLNYILATRFIFCGEQFASECFYIVKAIKLKEQRIAKSTTNQIQSCQSHIDVANLNKNNIGSKPSSPAPFPPNANPNQLPIHTQANIINQLKGRPSVTIQPSPRPNDRKMSQISAKSSLQESRNSVLGITVSISFDSKPESEKDEQSVVNKSHVLTSLIAPWLKPISFNLNEIGICKECEDDYKIFGIYSFANELLTLCSSQGMTQSIADILDLIIDCNPELFQQCLYDLQANSIINAKSATLFLIYIYNKIPDTFIKTIHDFLRVPAWYFYELQISKVDQMFDIVNIIGLPISKSNNNLSIQSSISNDNLKSVSSDINTLSPSQGHISNSQPLNTNKDQTLGHIKEPLSGNIKDQAPSHIKEQSSSGNISKMPIATISSLNIQQSISINSVVLQSSSFSARSQSNSNLSTASNTGDTDEEISTSYQKSRYDTDAYDKIDHQEKFEIEYHQVITFTLNLISECLKENELRLSNIRSYVLIFCLIHYSSYPEIADILIESITHIKPAYSNIGAAQNNVAMNRQAPENWKLSEMAPFIENSEKFILEWGLTCGDLSVASKALQIFELKGYILPDSALPTLISAMQSVSIAFWERTDPNNKHKFDQWLMRVVGENTRPNYEAVVSYLSSCLKILNRYILNLESNVIDINTFWTAASFLQCNSFEYSSLFIAAIQIVAQFFSKSNLLSLLKKNIKDYQKSITKRNTKNMNKFDLEFSRVRGGLGTFLLSICMQDSASINSIFTIISLIIENDLLNFFSSQRTGIYIATFALLPHIWMKFNKKDKSKRYCSLISKIIRSSINSVNEESESSHKNKSKSRSSSRRLDSNSTGDNNDEITEIENLLNQISYYETANPQSLTKLAKILNSHFSSDDLKLELNFFSQVIKCGSSAQKECVYIICSSVLESIMGLSEEISAIASYAVTDTSMQNSPNVLKFLRDLCLNEIRILPTSTQSRRTYSHFPQLCISKDPRDLIEWEPMVEDVFSDFKYYPPLFIVDFGFKGCTFLDRIKNAIDKIKTAPFDKWYDTLFKAQLQSVSTHSEIKEEKISPISVRPKDFISTFNENFQSDKQNERRYTIDLRRLSRIEALFKKEKEEIPSDKIEPECFFTENEELRNLIPRNPQLDTFLL